MCTIYQTVCNALRQPLWLILSHLCIHFKKYCVWVEFQVHQQLAAFNMFLHTLKIYKIYKSTYYITNRLSVWYGIETFSSKLFDKMWTFLYWIFNPIHMVPEHLIGNVHNRPLRKKTHTHIQRKREKGKQAHDNNPRCNTVCTLWIRKIIFTIFIHSFPFSLHLSRICWHDSVYNILALGMVDAAVYA